jgi:DNA-binding LacI/PurR family transcriptional regulator
VSSKSKLYEVIISYLEKQIADGAYDNNLKLPTEAELSKTFNVSRITAQRALDELEIKGFIYRKQGSGSYLNENTKHIINAENNNEPEIHENNVALILPYGILGGRFNEIIQSASDSLEQAGYALILYNSKTNVISERELILKLVRTNISGIILYPQHDRANIDLLYDIWLKKFPISIIDKKITDIPVCNIYSDNFTGSYLLTTELIKNGHSKIGCFYYVDLSDVSSVRQRFFGYCTALRENNIEIDYDYIINFYDNLHQAATKTRETILQDFLELGVTSIIAENDYAALDLIHICNQIEINIPNKFSIVGFDNVPQGEFSNPALTTVEQNFAAIGKSAAEAVIAQIEKRHYNTEQIIPVSVIHRKSIKKI